MDEWKIHLSLLVCDENREDPLQTAQTSPSAHPAGDLCK